MLILMTADLFCNLTAKIVRGYAKIPHSHDKNQMTFLIYLLHVQELADYLIPVIP